MSFWSFVLKVVVGAAIGVVVFPFIVKAVIVPVGFSAIGPVAGSAAAGIQSGIGSVAAGSLFASLQSLAMGGAPAIITAVGGFIGGLFGAV